MATPSQLQTVQKEINYVKAQIQDKETDLAIAQRAGDAAQVDFLRTRVVSLDKEIIKLREKENIMLQGQASGQHCSPCHHQDGLPAYAFVSSMPHAMMNTAGMKCTLAAHSCSQSASRCQPGVTG